MWSSHLEEWLFFFPLHEHTLFLLLCETCTKHDGVLFVFLPLSSDVQVLSEPVVSSGTSSPPADEPWPRSRSVQPPSRCQTRAGPLHGTHGRTESQVRDTRNKKNGEEIRAHLCLVTKYWLALKVRHEALRKKIEWALSLSHRTDFCLGAGKGFADAT